MTIPKTVAIPYIPEAIATIRQELRQNLLAFKALKQAIAKLHPKIEIKEPAPIAWFNYTNRINPTISMMINAPVKYTIKGNMSPLSRKENTIALAEYLAAMVRKGVPETVWHDDKLRHSLVNKKTDISPESFLVQYTNIKDLGLKDHEIRAAGIKMKTNEDDYELIICETPQDYVKMFSVATQSCMDLGEYAMNHWGTKSSNTAGYRNKDIWQEALDKHTLCPGSWYYWTKTSKGCYLWDKKNNIAVARAMLYQDSTGQFTKWRDCCSTKTADYTGKLTALLELQGYTEYGMLWGMDIKNEEFRIPAFMVDKELRCPLAYGNNVSYASFSFAFDQTTNEFVFRCKDRNGNPGWNTTGYAYDRHGYICAKDIYQLNPIELKKAA